MILIDNKMKKRFIDQERALYPSAKDVFSIQEMKSKIFSGTRGESAPFTLKDVAGFSSVSQDMQKMLQSSIVRLVDDVPLEKLFVVTLSPNDIISVIPAYPNLRVIVGKIIITAKGTLQDTDTILNMLNKLILVNKIKDLNIVLRGAHNAYTRMALLSLLNDVDSISVNIIRDKKPLLLFSYDKLNETFNPEMLSEYEVNSIPDNVKVTTLEINVENKILSIHDYVYIKYNVANLYLTGNYIKQPDELASLIMRLLVKSIRVQKGLKLLTTLKYECLSVVNISADINTLDFQMDRLKISKLTRLFPSSKIPVYVPKGVDVYSYSILLNDRVQLIIDDEKYYEGFDDVINLDLGDKASIEDLFIITIDEEGDRVASIKYRSVKFLTISGNQIEEYAENDTHKQILGEMNLISLTVRFEQITPIMTSSWMKNVLEIFEPLLLDTNITLIILFQKNTVHIKLKKILSGNDILINVNKYRKALILLEEQTTGNIVEIESNISVVDVESVIKSNPSISGIYVHKSVTKSVLKLLNLPTLKTLYISPNLLIFKEAFDFGFTFNNIIQVIVERSEDFDEDQLIQTLRLLFPQSDVTFVDEL